MFRLWESLGNAQPPGLAVSVFTLPVYLFIGGKSA